ncbi:cyclase family protein [uncultured Winogradskyella sp.]|uniref:cyclase family protein n=1 Tax=uncultured Winogradskyella sp. TaxID=395353 RepID=UPI0030DB498C
MITTIQYNSKKLKIDLSQPLDISIPLKGDVSNVNAWHVEPPKIAPEVIDGKTISVAKGAVVNFNTISFNPHSHGTHTETVGHITEKVYSVNKQLKQFFFLAEVVTVAPEKLGDDYVISKKQLEFTLGKKKRDAIVIRTLPNTKEKKSRQYSNTNPTYLLEDAANYIKSREIKHLLIDLPSVDKEQDGGKLLAHNAFWNTKGILRLDATITEFIYVSNKIEDGCYMLNLQIAPFENDASPSKPILYKILE